MILLILSFYSSCCIATEVKGDYVSESCVQNVFVNWLQRKLKYLCRARWTHVVNIHQQLKLQISSSSNSYLIPRFPQYAQPSLFIKAITESDFFCCCFIRAGTARYMRNRNRFCYWYFEYSMMLHKTAAPLCVVISLWSYHWQCIKTSRVSRL